MSLDDFVLPTPRPLPVIVLADASGSMHGSKIAALNAALRELSQDLAQATTPQGEVHLGFVIFNERVDVRPPLRAAEVVWQEVQADGQTRMGGALDAVRELLEDKERLPPRAYTPTLVLASDGAPTDHFTRALRDLMASERAAKATRVALAIGEDADLDVLREFVANVEIPVIRADEVAKIRDFFRWVTFSVRTRSKSIDPDASAVAPLVGFDEDDLVF
jgi:uncharacterized protein YegL